MIPGVDNLSPSWRVLKKHITERIAELQLHLEVPNGRCHTNMLRGSIMELRALIERVEPVEPAVFDNETTGPCY